MNGTTALLLRATTLAPEPAFAAYSAWKREQDFETLSFIDLQVLPKLYQNLADHLTDDLAPRLRGIYRRAWTEQQRRVAVEASLPTLPPVFVWRDRAANDLLAQSDLFAPGALTTALSPFGRLPGSQAKRIWHWRTQGWVHLPNGLRLFRESPENPLLHQLFGTGRPVLWLARALPDLRKITDWQGIFVEAAAFGLRRRLHHAVDWAMQSGLLDPHPLPQTFSRLDDLRFARLQTTSRAKGLGLAAAIGLHRSVFHLA